MWSATGHLEAERSGPITFGQVERTPTNQNNGTAVSGLASEQLIRYTFQLTDASTIGGPVHIFNYTFTSCKHAVCTGFLYGALLNAFSIPLLAHRTLCCDNYPTDKVRVRLFTGVDRSSYNGLFAVCMPFTIGDYSWQYVTLYTYKIFAKNKFRTTNKILFCGIKLFFCRKGRREPD